MTTIKIKATSTEYIDMKLTSDGSAINLTGCNVEIRLKYDDKTTENFDTVNDATRIQKLTPLTDGKVRFKPTATTFGLKRKSADVFYWVTDAENQKIPYPGKGSLRIETEVVW